jgi:thiamine-phosphate pyrophosphorylase
MTPSWLAASRLWLVTDSVACAPRSCAEAARLCLEGGADVVLCRVKDVERAAARQIAADVRAVCRRLAKPFVMSHDVQTATELAADGVQLGAGDPPLAEIRTTLGEAMAIGYSTHSVAEAAQRFEEGVDYVFLGPIFPTPAKLRYGAPLGLSAVEPALRLRGPVVFIGGIGEGNIREITALGGMRVAAISALQRATDPRDAATRLKALLPD